MMLYFGIIVTEVEKRVIEIIAQSKIGDVKIKTDIDNDIVLQVSFDL